MERSEIIITLNWPYNFGDNGVHVEVLGSKDGHTPHIIEACYVDSVGSYRKPPYPSTSVDLDSAIDFFIKCLAACQKVKYEIEEK